MLSGMLRAPAACSMAVMDCSWNVPPCSSAMGSKRAPSSVMVVLKGGMEPGELPPTSA